MFHLAVFIASLVFLYFGNVLVAVLLYSFGLLVTFDWPVSFKPLYKKIFPVFSENVEAKLEVPGAKKTIVISAHYDTPRATSGIWIMKLFSYLVRNQLHDKNDPTLDIPIPPPYKSPLFILYFAVSLQLVAIALHFLNPPLGNLILIISLVLQIILFAFITVNSFAPYVPGALDNGASVALTLGLAGYFSTHKPKKFNLVFLNTGSEENVEKGMDNYIKMNKPSRRDTYFINLDTVGEKNLIALYGEVNDVGLQNYYDADEFREVIEAIHAREPFNKIKTALAPSATDASSLTQMGYKVVTTLLSLGKDGFNPNYHQRSDTLAKINHANLELAEDFVIYLVETLNN
jgi:hypothetical protein